VAGDDPRRAADAAEGLLGRGPGLTPEGDDLLAGVAAALAAARGPAARWPEAPSPRRLRALTTPLSATLLELAAAGRVVEPIRALLDLTPAGERAWPAAMRRLERIGHSTGPACAAGVGAALVLLAGSRARSREPPAGGEQASV
jgi:hypothetical protein